MLFRLLVYIFFLTFLLVKNGLLERQLLDLTVLIASLFFINIRSLPIFLILSISSILLYLNNGNVFSLLNMSFLPIVLLTFKPKKVFLDYNTVLFITLYCFSITVFDLLTANFVEAGDRISGPFTSSLHLSYFCVFFSYYLSLQKENKKYFLGFLVFICAIISGSRVAALGVLAMFMLNFNLKRIGYFIILFIPVIIYFTLKLELRSFSYIPEAEDLRFGGFYNFFKIVDFKILFVGLGRFTYGATGFRFVGENAFITESSMIMIFYSYGVLLGAVLIFFVLKYFYRLTVLKGRLYHFIAFIMLIIFSPLLDSTAVLFLNSLILSNLNVSSFNIRYNTNRQVG